MYDDSSESAMFPMLSKLCFVRTTKREVDDREPTCDSRSMTSTGVLPRPACEQCHSECLREAKYKPARTCRADAPDKETARRG